MVELKRNVTRMRGRGIPGISFENVETKLGIANLYSDKKDIYEYLALILLRFEFEPEDMIFICNYNKEDNSFDCVRDNVLVCRIRIDKNNREIVVSKYNEEYGYRCVSEERSELGMIIILDRYITKYADGMVYTRYFSRDYAKFVVDGFGYRLELELDKPEEIKLRLFDEGGKYAKYRLDDEMNIVEYLIDYALNQDITHVYNVLSVNYLDDVRKYPNFYLRKYTTNGEDKLVDLVHLKNGELEKFGMTDFDMTVFLDKDNNWSYEVSKCDTVPVDFSMFSSDGKVSCSFSFDEEDTSIKKYMNNQFDSEVKSAIDEVRDVKRLVRRWFY